MASTGSAAQQFEVYQTQTMWILCGNGLNNREASSKQFGHSDNNLTMSQHIEQII